MLYKNSAIVKKKQQGQFFTHPTIANQIVREVCEIIISDCFWKPWRSLGNSLKYPDVNNLLTEVLSLRFVDPAMGDGVFLIEVIQFFENFISLLWNETYVSSYFDHICAYFRKKLALDFSLVGAKDQLTFDIWRFHIVRSMIYGVDLDPTVVEKAQEKIVAKFSTSQMAELTKSIININLKVGNSLISPLRMERASTDNLISNYPMLVDNLLSTRVEIQEAYWVALSKEEIVGILKKNELLKKQLEDQVFKDTNNEFSSLFKSPPSEHNCFIWELEFPEIFFSEKVNGFSAVIGNPPWDKWKLYDREWLGSTALGKPTHVQQMNEIKRNNSKAHLNYLQAKKFYKSTTEYFNRYFQWQPGEKNLFKLFMERFYTLCCANGILGIILPGGLLGEFYSQPLRKMLLTKMRLHFIIEIVSNNEMFPDAEPGLSILIILAQKTSPIKQFPFVKGISSTEDLTKIKLKNIAQNRSNLIYFSRDDILRSSPRYIVPAVRNELELQIIQKMTRFPSLSSATWGCKTSRGIDMTNDRELLVEYETPNPLIEGRHLVRLGFDNTHPRYWIRSFDEYQRKIPFWNQTIIVWKNFSGNHRRRRMRIAILPPKTVISNSVICIYNLPPISESIFYLAGMMCSIPFEFRIRQLCYGININQYIMDSMPVPIFNPSLKIHQKMASIVNQFIPLGSEWAKRKMEAPSSLSKARLEEDYQDTITMIDALSAVIYELNRSEFEETLAAHPQLEEKYRAKALNHYELLLKQDLN
ncbi:MAG: hypothetical protein JSV04_04595 [Candidatus Heimdallarchaeota archaeon]|nr:MAG: hypothetical protein JSV04_04595 [Candidatus Heimdallarchaeota archaeon]